MQINTQRENKTVEYNILLRYGLELCITQLCYSFRFLVFGFFFFVVVLKFLCKAISFLPPLWWYVLLSAIFLQCSCFPPSFAYIYPQSNKDCICLQVFPFPSENIYAPCAEQSSSSSLPPSLQRTGQRGEGSGFSALSHQSYHSGVVIQIFSHNISSQMPAKSPT